MLHAKRQSVVLSENTAFILSIANVEAFLFRLVAWWSGGVSLRRPGGGVTNPGLSIRVLQSLQPRDCGHEREAVGHSLIRLARGFQGLAHRFSCRLMSSTLLIMSF